MLDAAVTASLERLLRELFSNAGQLAQFTQYLTGGKAIVQELPDATSASLTDYCHKLVLRLNAKGELDNSFFDALAADYRGREQDIRMIRQRVERTPLGRWLVTDVAHKSSQAILASVSRITSIPVLEAHERCTATPHGDTVRQRFYEDWPTRETIGEWTTDQVRSADFIADSADLLDMPVETFELGLLHHAGARLKDIFPNKFPRPAATRMASEPARAPVVDETRQKQRPVKLREMFADKPPRQPHAPTITSARIDANRSAATTPGRLGELTLTEVDRRDLRPTLTAFLTARGIMQKKGVSQRFNNNHGGSLVRNVWPRIPREEWPLV